MVRCCACSNSSFDPNCLSRVRPAALMAVDADGGFGKSMDSPTALPVVTDWSTSALVSCGDRWSGGR